MFLTRYLSLFSLLICSSLTLITLTAYAQTSQEEQSLNIVINIPSRTLDLYSGAVLIKEYLVAVGAPASPSPIGSYKIYYKEMNPTWIPPKKVGIPQKAPVRSGPDNPLGYRWMEFMESYGVHGTNAPWSIGTAVSNGCIRMQEADIDDLFEKVSIGTPLSITYERVKITEDASRQVVLMIYPDIYKIKRIEMQDLKDKLAQAGFSGAVSDERLKQMLNSDKDQKNSLVDSVTVKVNGQEISERALFANRTLYIPIISAGRLLQDSIVWNETKGLVSNKYNTVQGISIRANAYVTGENFKKLYGGEQSWNEQKNIYEINVTQVYINGRCIPLATQRIEEVLAVPVISLAKELGITITQDKATDAFTYDNNKIPIKIVGDEGYILINKIDEAFRGFVYWNQEKRRIDITYPSNEE